MLRKNTLKAKKAQAQLSPPFEGEPAPLRRGVAGTANSQYFTDFNFPAGVVDFRGIL